jgi:predicted Zn finger-like uncharacterized protein
MILSCNSCNKKFVVPDNAVTKAGRLVQCSSCGNKWRQFPIKQEEAKLNEKFIEKNLAPKKPINTSKIKKKIVKKRSGPNLYSPEYLAKKHGIRIDGNNVNDKRKKIKDDNISFGFYNSFLILVVIIIFILRVMYFTQDIIIELFPESKNYIDYLFESIRNIKVIIQNFFTNY